MTLETSDTQAGEDGYPPLQPLKLLICCSWSSADLCWCYSSLFITYSWHISTDHDDWWSFCGNDHLTSIMIVWYQVEFKIHTNYLVSRFAVPSLNTLQLNNSHSTPPFATARACKKHTAGQFQNEKRVTAVWQRPFMHLQGNKLDAEELKPGSLQSLVRAAVDAQKTFHDMASALRIPLPNWIICFGCCMLHGLCQ